MINVKYAPGNHVLYMAEGNPKASIVIILGNPGAREIKEGEQYVCGTRQTKEKILDYSMELFNEVIDLVVIWLFIVWLIIRAVFI